MFCQRAFSSVKWISPIYIIILLAFSSDRALGQLAMPDAQFIADFIASSPGFSASFQGVDICGLTTQFSCVNGHLTIIYLSQNLGGSIPDSIGSLPKLTSLTLKQCSLSGTIPASLANVTNLTSLDLSANLLQGSIPAGIFKFSLLKSISLSSNQLSGTIPDVILPKMDAIFLDHNLLTGSIPPSLFQLPVATHIDLNTNRLTGTIPDLNLPAITLFYLGKNQLSGTLPASLFTASNKTFNVMSVISNQLTGTLPVEFVATKIRSVLLSDNLLSGTVPDLTTNRDIINLALASNLFTGHFPLFSSDVINTIHLDNNKLSGTIPYNALNTPNLYGLYLSSNKLEGTLPSFKNATNLFDLDLSLNRFSGQLDELYNLARITAIDLSSNSFTGEFVPSPTWINLAKISIRSNKFVGSFPQFNSATGPLFYDLDFSFNQFSGTISADQLSILAYLQNLKIQGNSFSGTLPNFPKDLVSIDVSNNNFVGTLPDTVGQLLQLTDLSVANNQLEGTIPDIFNTISRLYTLNMEFNKFSGSLPPSIGGLAFLTSAIFSSNELNGTIPPIIESLQSVQVLKLDNNNFEGTIPEEIGNLPSLTQLALENNKLSGTIPSSILNLSALSSLTLQNNQLSGTVSTLINSLEGLKQLNLANNKLMGFFEPTMALIECNLASNDFCCGENISSACQKSAPCSGARKVVAQNETISSSQQYQALDVPAGVVLLVDPSTTIETQCLRVNGDIQLIVSDLPQENSANFVAISYSHAFTDLHTGDLNVVESEKCTDFKAQMTDMPASDTTRGYLTVSLTTSAIEGCSNLSEAVIYALAFGLGIGIPLVIALIVVIVLWRKGRFRRNIRQQVSMDIMNSLADKSFLTPSTSIKVERELGAGSFGKVYVGRWQQTQVAFKFCNVPSKMDEFLREAALMMKLTPHPNVVQLLAISIDGAEPVIVLEYCDGGSLDNLLFDSTAPISDEDKIRIASGIARGMLHLHRNNIVHRDLAARNVLLQKGTPKVSDFGMSRLLQVNQESKTYSNVGPIRWMAPESLRDRINTPKSDVWMYGIVLTEIITQSEPHINEDMFAIGAKIRDQGVIPAVPNETHPLLKQLVTMCLKMNADDRPDFESICRHIDEYCNANRITLS